MSDVDRITPYKDVGDIADRIDEIVSLNGNVHIEMMSNGSAWMRIRLGEAYGERRDDQLGREHGAQHNDLVPLMRCSKCGSKDLGIQITPHVAQGY